MKGLKTNLFFLFLLLTKLLHSQEINLDSITPRPMNSFNLNLGDASGISLSYERLFKIGENFLLAAKLGLGINQEFEICLGLGDCNPDPDTYISLPVRLTLNYGKHKNFFEAGIGASRMYGNLNQHFWVYPIIGYRLQPFKSGKFNLRVYGAFPLSGNILDDFFFMPTGISTGIVF